MAKRWNFSTYLKRLRPVTKHTESLQQTARFLRTFHNKQGQLICPCGEEISEESLTITEKVLELRDYPRCASCVSIILFLRVAEYRMRVRYLRRKTLVQRKPIKGQINPEYLNSRGLTVGEVIELSRTQMSLHLTQSTLVRLRRQSKAN